MELLLHRRYLGKEYTIGSLYIRTGEETEYFCDTLEDVDRGLTQSMPPEEIKRIKIPHETAIPAGIYRVTVNMSPAKRRMLPRLPDVPGFSGILIHRGNTKNDSSGCILVGENKVKGKVINSTQYEKRLVGILTGAQERGEAITIRIGTQGIAETHCEDISKAPVDAEKNDGVRPEVSNTHIPVSSSVIAKQEGADNGVETQNFAAPRHTDGIHNTKPATSRHLCAKITLYPTARTGKRMRQESGGCLKSAFHRRLCASLRGRSQKQSIDVQRRGLLHSVRNDGKCYGHRHCEGLQGTKQSKAKQSGENSVE